MDNIIASTYNFLDALDNSEMIKNLTISKKHLESNNHILSLVKEYNKELSPENKLKIKKELYLNDYYKMYMNCYNELSYLILKINKQYKKYTNTKNHLC